MLHTNVHAFSGLQLALSQPLQSFPMSGCRTRECTGGRQAVQLSSQSAAVGMQCTSMLSTHAITMPSKRMKPSADSAYSSRGRPCARIGAAATLLSAALLRRLLGAAGGGLRGRLRLAAALPDACSLSQSLLLPLSQDLPLQLPEAAMSLLPAALLCISCLPPSCSELIPELPLLYWHRLQSNVCNVWYMKCSGTA